VVLYSYFTWGAVKKKLFEKAECRSRMTVDTHVEVLIGKEVVYTGLASLSNYVRPIFRYLYILHIIRVVFFSFIIMISATPPTIIDQPNGQRATATAGGKLQACGSISKF
jgi:hypothetical protein